MQKYFTVVWLMGLALSCESPIVFGEPQPRGVSEQEAFENIYQGVYFCEEDSALIIVSPEAFFKEKGYSFTLPKVELDTMQGVEIENNRIFIRELNRYATIEYMSDSVVVGNLKLRDTIFRIGTDQVLKYYKGHQILNRKLSDGKWEVSILRQDQTGSLSFLWTVLPDDMEKLEAITPVKDISTEQKERFELSPTRTAFKTLLKTQLIFEECDVFERLGDLQPVN